MAVHGSYSALSFRAASTEVHDLTVRLIDKRGRFKDVAVSSVSDALKPLQGSPDDGQPKLLLRTVRIPVSTPDIRAIEFRSNRVSQGTVFVSDLAFSNWSRGRTTLPSMPRLSIADAPVIRESAKTADFVVSLSKPSSLPVTVHVETSGFSYDPEIITPIAEDLTFPPRPNPPNGPRPDPRQHHPTTRPTLQHSPDRAPKRGPGRRLGNGHCPGRRLSKQLEHQPTDHRAEQQPLSGSTYSRRPPPAPTI